MFDFLLQVVLIAQRFIVLIIQDTKKASLVLLKFAIMDWSTHGFQMGRNKTRTYHSFGAAFT